MRCRSCDVNLSDFESTRKSKITGDYFDLCDPCFSTIQDDIIIIEETKEQKELIDDKQV